MKRETKIALNDQSIFILCKQAGPKIEPVAAFQLHQRLGDEGISWSLTDHTNTCLFGTERARLDFQPAYPLAVSIHRPVTMHRTPYGWRLIYHFEYLDGWRIHHLAHLRKKPHVDLSIVPAAWLAN